LADGHEIELISCEKMIRGTLQLDAPAAASVVVMTDPANNAPLGTVVGMTAAMQSFAFAHVIEVSALLAARDVFTCFGLLHVKLAA
jgi:hypothetical protein